MLLSYFLEEMPNNSFHLHGWTISSHNGGSTFLSVLYAALYLCFSELLKCNSVIVVLRLLFLVTKSTLCLYLDRGAYLN